MILANSLKTQLVDLKTALLKDDLFEVTYRNDDGNTQNYYMEIVNFDAQVETGENHNGTVQLIMVEPRQTTAR